ncbi:MAG TPA: hypothetical protein VEY88_13970 [Archangium sp.]|nr:hypothetical protein [Archangium sp.]
MKNSQLITVDVPGLDLTLGGGIWAVRRMPDVDASATLLIRGPPGSGKTAFGTLLAGALGRALKGDVAYGCVELLPVELQAQHENLRGPDAPEQVFIPPFYPEDTETTEACRIFAELLEDVHQSGGRPRVLVIDSLSEGYQLGSSAPRVTADALSKLVAAQGLILILLEEAVDSRHSTWSFTADVVLELASGEESSAAGASARFERRVTVIKNRFGPSDAGPHHFEILPSGLHLFPRPTAYLSPWSNSFLGITEDAIDPSAQGWNITDEVDEVDSSRWPHFRECVTAVHGPHADVVFQVTHWLGSPIDDMMGNSVIIFVDFMIHGDEEALTQSGRYRPDTWVVPAGNPYLSGHRLLAMVRAALEECRRNNLMIQKVLVGDVRSLRSFWNPEGIRRAIGTLAALLRPQIPLVLFETTVPRKTWRQFHLDGTSEEYLVDTGASEPAIVDFADVTVEIIETLKSHAPFQGRMTVTRSGESYSWLVKPAE